MIQVRAMRGVGELSKQLPSGKREPKTELLRGAAGELSILKAAGVSEDQVISAENVAAIPTEEVERITDSSA